MTMFKSFLDRFFPVFIHSHFNRLVIDDRRPSRSFVFSVALATAFLVAPIIIYQWGSINLTHWLLLFFLLTTSIFIIASLFLPFRENYVFDKDQDSFILISRSILKSLETQGYLSQIRALQIERQEIVDEDKTREIFRITLLMRSNLLLGAPDTLVLRKRVPIGSRFEDEAYIGNAIAKFLGLPLPKTVTL